MVNERTYEALGLAQRLVVFAFLGVGLWYLAWRPGTFNPEAPIFSGLIYGVELYGFLTALLHAFMVWRLSRPQPAPLPEAGLGVDVFVPTLNEDPDLVRRTLLAADRMDYPHSLWLLDDGNRSEMAALAAEVGCHYLAREGNRHGKAGNLNHALAHAKGEFVAVFDADHAPRRDFLHRVLGYFRDPELAFVQTPQDYYNLDSYQHRSARGRRTVWTEQSLFFRVIMPGKDRHNAAFFAGSCAVLRRSALDAIGGFAPETITEDLHTSIRFHKRGYRSLYHAEALAFGLAPPSLRPFLRQRLRWGAGAMQVWRREGVLFARGLSLPQRLSYLASMLTYFDGWQKAVFYSAPAFVLMTGVMPIAHFGWVFLAHFVPFYLLNFWAFEELGRGYGNTFYIEQYNMARFAAFMRSTLGLLRRPRGFRVTPKGGVADGGLPVIPQGLVLLVNSMAIPVGAVLFLAGNGLSTGAFAANLFWASLNGALAGSVLLFTWGLRRRRKEYRFPTALPARVALVDSGSSGTLGLVEDLSPEGLCLRLPAPAGELEEGRVMAGEILLPNGPVPFRGQVRGARVAGLGDRWWEVRLRLQELSQPVREELLRFLYGSDLQWFFGGLRERGRTPVEVIRSWFGRSRDRREGKVPDWVPVACRASDPFGEAHKGAGYRRLSRFGEEFATGLRLPSGRLDRITLGWEVPRGALLQVSTPGQRGLGVAVYRVQAARRLATPLGPLFIHTLQSPIGTSHAPSQPAVLVNPPSAAS